MIHSADFQPAKPLAPGVMALCTCVARSGRCSPVASHS